MFINKLTFMNFALVVSAFGQSLYLISGNNSRNDMNVFPTALLQVADGRVTRKTLIESDTNWVAISYDFRRAVVLGKDIHVIDFEQPLKMKRCADPPGPLGGLMGQWLIDSPQRGPVFVEYLFGDRVEKAWLRAMSLDGARACAESFSTLPGSEIRFAVFNGWAGVADMVTADADSVRIEPDGRLGVPIARVFHYFEPQLPMALIRDFATPGGGIFVNDSHVLVLSITDANDPGKGAVCVYRKRDRTWDRLPVEGAWVRGFGDYIAVLDAKVKTPLRMESAGKTGWFDPKSREKQGVGSRFKDSTHVFQGQLHLYNVESKKLMTIVTNQGDSEIVLVKDSYVYYRVSDRLYRAALTGDRIEKGELIATSEDIREVHWAFIQR